MAELTPELAIRPTPELVTRVATGLAQALDRNDYIGAAEWIASDCVYQVRDEAIIGSAEILASYADTAEWARQQFDEIRNESEVGSPEGDTAPVLYTDYLMKVPGQWHRHRCRQHLTLGAEGRVIHILHEDLPGEVEALEAYFKVCGIER
ncbi:MAG: hypothetical protein ABIS67_08240 [Candidatus Eisenbacteria bacterium]